MAWYRKDAGRTTLDELCLLLERGCEKRLQLPPPDGDSPER
jgi:hypothetical protein